MLSSILLPLVTLATLVPSALGRITNITFPSTAYLGETLQINVTDTIYVQQWSDLGVLFGFQAPQYRCGTCVGQGPWYQNLYNEPAYSGTNGTKLSNYTIDVPVPPYLNTSYDYNIVAAISYYAGASGTTGIRYFNQSILITQPPTTDDEGDSNDA